LLVAGGGGFIGRVIAEAAATVGFDVHVTWRKSPPPPEFPAHRLSLDDHLATDRLLSSLRPDVVVATLGGPHRPITAESRRAAWRDGLLATTCLLEASRPTGTHFVLLASSHEFAPSSTPHDERSAVGAVSVRGIASRAACEAVRLWGSETGAPTTILRPFSVYGPGEPADRVIPTLLRAAMTGEPFHMTPSPSSRDFVFVTDVADAVVRAAAGRVAGEFNLGTGRSTSVDDLVEAVELVTGRCIDVRRGSFEPRPWDRATWVADPSHAANGLGWTATTSLVEGLRRSLP
jgi:UDP-glucose 4-epimerase